MAILIAIISQFLVGYNTSVMNAPAAYVFPDHTTLQWSFAVSAFAVGGPFGAVLGGYLSNLLGRRGTMIATAWIFFFGGALMTASQNVYWLIPARLIVGFASGVSSVVVPVYLGEISPPTMRGTVGTFTQFSIVIGILVSCIVAIPFYGIGADADVNVNQTKSSMEGWRYLFGITPLLSLCQILSSSFLLESPRWLLNKDENSTAARYVIKKLRGFSRMDAIELEVQHFMFAAQRHKTSWHSAHSSGAMGDLLRSRELRPLVVCRYCKVCVCVYFKVKGGGDSN
jgi:SP family facilitated glucose transporter-like MFS transporter 3